MKYVLFYESMNGSGEEMMAALRLHYPAHRARLDAFHARGVLLWVGPFAKPEQGAMGVFTTADAAEEFMQGDPFMTNGIVKTWSVREWREIYGPP